MESRILDLVGRGLSVMGGGGRVKLIDRHSLLCCHVGTEQENIRRYPKIWAFKAFYFGDGFAVGHIQQHPPPGHVHVDRRTTWLIDWQPRWLWPESGKLRAHGEMRERSQGEWEWRRKCEWDVKWHKSFLGNCGLIDCYVRRCQEGDW